jgi:hypothetical protein
MRDRGPGKCKDIAGEPRRADRFERLLGQAWAQGGETDQEKRQKADQRKRQIEIHRAKDAPAHFERCIVIAAPLVGERSKDQRQGENDPRRPPADEQGRCPEHEQEVRGPIAQRRKQAAGVEPRRVSLSLAARYRRRQSCPNLIPRPLRAAYNTRPSNLMRAKGKTPRQECLKQMGNRFNGSRLPCGQSELALPCSD